MMRFLSMRNLAPFCGVILGLLVLCNTAAPNILHASDNAGGWHLVPIGGTCVTSTTLPCPEGDDVGVHECGGGSFPGVVEGTGGTITSLGYPAGCSTSSNPDSWYCPNVMATYCKH